jgi:hypothetical protein
VLGKQLTRASQRLADLRRFLPGALRLPSRAFSKKSRVRQNAFCALM